MTKLGYIVVQTQLAFQTAWTQTVKVRTAALPPTVFVTPATDTARSSRSILQHVTWSNADLLLHIMREKPA